MKNYLLITLLHAEGHRGLDEDAQMVGVVAEHVEAAAPSHDARLLRGDVLQHLRLGIEYLLSVQQAGGTKDRRRPWRVPLVPT